MSKHTAGPWQLADNGLAVYGPGEEPWGVAYMPVYDRPSLARGEGIPDDEQRANGRLIAESPMMSALLREALPELDECAERTTSSAHERALNDLIARIRAALARIDGE